MNIAIFGGSGFIGSRLRDDLLDRGHSVLTISRSPQSPRSSKHTHSSMSAEDHEGMRSLLHGVDVLFHLASDSTPGSTRLKPEFEGTANLQPSLALLSVLQGLPGLCLVFVSSGGAVYRAGENLQPSTEESPLSPCSYYGAGKLAMELFIEAYQQQTGNAAIILRPSNLYGPGQYAKRQFGIVPTLLAAARDGSTFTIWGDGSARRDFLYIDDFLDLCDRAIAPDGASRPLAVFNAGSGEGVSILELCHLVEQVTGRPLRREFAPQRGVDMPVARLDTDKARIALGWSAQTRLEHGLERTWQWFLESRP